MVARCREDVRYASSLRWLRGVVKTYDTRRLCGVITPMDGGKDVHFSAKCVEGDGCVGFGDDVYFQDFISGDRRTACAVLKIDEMSSSSSDDDR